MTASHHKITLVFDASDLACLRRILQGRIDEADRHDTLCGDLHKPETAVYTARFRDQLRTCLRVINEAGGAVEPAKAVAP